MTNELAIATIVMVSYVTNIIDRPPENGPRGNTWYRTNVISAVLRLTPPGLPTVTNTVAVATNVTRLRIVEEAIHTTPIPIMIPPASPGATIDWKKDGTFSVTTHGTGLQRSQDGTNWQTVSETHIHGKTVVGYDWRSNGAALFKSMEP